MRSARHSAALILALIVAGCGAAGCGKPAAETSGGGQAGGPTPLIDPQLIVAETRLGPITAADLDRYVLSLPPDQRLDGSDDRAAADTRCLRRIAVERLLLDEAVLVGADQDVRFRALERRIERNAVSEHYLGGLPPGDPITPDEVRAAYEENLESYQREEKRQLYHIYKRFDADTGREQALALMARVRERLLAGESVELLAREHSDSETRHDGGLVGNVARGHFTEDFDHVVFALEERVPSQPLATRDGVHLFLVEDVLEERDFSFEEMRLPLRRELEAARRDTRRRDAAAALPQPEERLVPGPREIGQILGLGDPGTALLRLGDFTLTIVRFQEILQTERRLLGAKHAPDLPRRLLEEIHDREVIYQHLRTEGPDAASQERLRAERDAELAEFHARRKMSSWLERRPEIVQRHYDGNRMRFASPLRVRLRLLSIPIQGDGVATMAELEAARADLDAGRRQLEDLAAAHGGEIQDVGFVSAAQVQAMAPRAMRFVFFSQAGEHTPPYASERALFMFQVAERQDPRPRALALVRDEVMRDYLTHYSADVFERLADEMLEEAAFRIHAERLPRRGSG